MIVSISHNKKKYEADLSRAIDISIPMHSKSVTAWYAPNIQISAVKNGDWVGDTSLGAPVNFNNIFLTPMHMEPILNVWVIFPKKSNRLIRV